MKKILFAFVILANSSLYAAIDMTSSVTNWNAVSYGGLYPDYYNDQQTGQYDSDIVGTNNAPAFYTKFDNAGTTNLTDGTLAFRVRMSGSSKTYWENVLFIGMDADQNGSIDLFAGLYKNNTVNLYYPGTGLNVSPSTTTISPAFYSTAAVSSNYSFVAVSSVNAFGQPTDIDLNGQTDYFVSFSISFAQIVSGLAATNIVINENSPMVFLAATATQQNSMNQDLNGPPKNFDGSWTWTQLGASSTPITPTGVTVPEPAVAGLFALGCLTLRYIRRFTDPTRAGRL